MTLQRTVLCTWRPYHAPSRRPYHAPGGHTLHLQAHGNTCYHNYHSYHTADARGRRGADESDARDVIRSAKDVQTRHLPTTAQTYPSKVRLGLGLGLGLGLELGLGLGLGLAYNCSDIPFEGNANNNSSVARVGFRVKV